MVPFDVVTGVFNVISNSRRVIIFQKGLEILRFPVGESSLRFPNVKIIANHNYPKSFVAGTALSFTLGNLPCGTILFGTKPICS